MSEEPLKHYQQLMGETLLAKTSADAMLASEFISVPDNVQAEDFTRERLAVYQNNVMFSLIRALTALYPVTEKLTGEQFFRALARDYVLQYPPESPVISYYGSAMSAFIEKHEQCRPLPYLADMARLEWYCHCALHAKDASLLGPEILQQLQADKLHCTGLLLAPCVHLLRSAFPLQLIWSSNLEGRDDVVDLSREGADDLLVYRKDWQVQVVRLAPEHYHALDGFRQGLSIEAVLTAGMQAFELDEAALGGVLGYLLGLNVFSELREVP